MALRYTYTVFDGDPASSGPCEWPHMSEVAHEAESDEDAIEEIGWLVEPWLHGLSRSDGYSEGDLIHVLIWDRDGSEIEHLRYRLTEEHLGEPEEEELT